MSDKTHPQLMSPLFWAYLGNNYPFYPERYGAVEDAMKAYAEADSHQGGTKAGTAAIDARAKSFAAVV